MDIVKSNFTHNTILPVMKLTNWTLNNYERNINVRYICMWTDKNKTLKKKQMYTCASDIRITIICSFARLYLFLKPLPTFNTLVNLNENQNAIKFVFLPFLKPGNSLHLRAARIKGSNEWAGQRASEPARLRNSS